MEALAAAVTDTAPRTGSVPLTDMDRPETEEDMEEVEMAVVMAVDMAMIDTEATATLRRASLLVR
jgi:hypothetical protein